MSDFNYQMKKFLQGRASAESVVDTVNIMGPDQFLNQFDLYAFFPAMTDSQMVAMDEAINRSLVRIEVPEEVSPALEEEEVDTADLHPEASI